MHTASLGPIRITDLNGNYIPGSENWFLTGDSGLQYAVAVPQAVPEPATQSLVGAALAGWLFALRRRGRQVRESIRGSGRLA
jgi:hypothetical protein